MLRSIILLLLGSVILGCKPESGSTHRKSLDIQLTWTLITNVVDGGGHLAKFTIANNSGTALDDSNWALYWNMAPRTVDSESIEVPVTIEWINGDYYVMKPEEGFALPTGESAEITYKGSAWMIKESDAPLGPYIAILNDDGSEDLSIIYDYTITPFETPDQINRSTGDLEPIPTAEFLYQQNAIITDLPEDQIQMIVPKPRSANKGEGSYDIKSGISVHFDEGLANEGLMLGALLDEILDGNFAVDQSDISGPDIIRLVLNQNEDRDAYTLNITEGGITISGGQSGVFYGIQSLKALIPIENYGKQNTTISVPTVVIEDSPAFDYRGMHLDVGRNFNSLESVKRLLDAMAFYKLNKLHLNLTEDEGWRIEIEALPELTEVGGHRGHTKDDADHLQPSYGSGPFTDGEYGYGNGYYSKEEYIELLKYAWDRHIEVIPEVNVPGHSRSAIKAMEKRYRKFMDENNRDAAEQYRLIDPQDTSKYRSAQWYTDNIICVCRESSVEFMKVIVDAFIEMHEEAGVPLNMFHTGGDEVPRGAWTGSPMCAEYLKQHPEIDNSKNLQKDYFRKIDDYIDSKGIQTGGWEEIAMNFKEDGSWTPNDEFANSDVIPYIWNSLWGAEDLGNRLANAGYPVVLCNVTNFYFDLAYNKDPREPGLYWGGFINTRDAFEFVPYDLFKSVISDPSGRKYEDADFEGKEILSEEGKNNILGIQAQLWSETIKGGEMLEYYYLPKMMGLAERAWFGQEEWGSIEDREERTSAMDAAWNSFANVVGKREMPRLDHMNRGYNYRLASPGAIVENNLLKVNTAFPGMELRYTTDGSDPTKDSPLYEAPLEVGPGTLKISTFDTRGRSSFPTVINIQ